MPKEDNASHIFEFEVDTGEIDGYQWTEDHPTPLLIRPRVKMKKCGGRR